MAKSVWAAIREIQDIQDRIIAGEFPQRSPFGPGVIQTKNIKARAITAPLIDVSNLAAVNTQTGSLNVDGTVEIGASGRLISGTNTADFATFTTSPGGGLGYYLTYHATYGALMAVGDFNNVTGQYIKWDGSALTIKGVVTASSGAIAGWTITSDAIENSGGTVGMASSGHSGYSFWAGDATPASAEFSVTSAGALVASSATITGAITASSGSLTGVLTVGGSGGINLSSAGGKIYSGQSVFNTGTGFHLANSGGTGVFSIGEGSGGAKHLYYDGSNLVIKGTINATAGNFTGGVTIGTGGSISSGQTAYNTGTGWWLDYNAGTPRFSIGNGSTESLTWNGTALAVRGTITADDGTLGTLNVSGALTLGTGGVLQSSGASFGSTGIYLDYNAGTPRFSLGSKLSWNGSALTLDGALTSTSGTIGGWTIDSTNGLKLGTGSTTRGIHTGSTAFYAGNATPSSAPFNVTSAGVLTASSATITGSITASSLTITGTANFSGGSMTLPGGGSITSSTLDLNSGTMAGLTVDGTIDVSTSGVIKSGASSITGGTGWWLEYNSGTPRFRIGQAVSAGNNYLYWNGSSLEMQGKLKWGTSGQHYIDSGIVHFEATTSGFNAMEWKKGAASKYSYLGHILAQTSTDGYDNESVTLRTTGYNNNANLSIGAYDDSSPAVHYAYAQAGAGSVLLASFWDSQNSTYKAGAVIGSSSSRFFEVNDGGLPTFDGGRVFAISGLGTMYLKRNTSGSESTVPIHTGVSTSGALPNATKFLKVYDESGGTAYYIPAYTAVNPWAA